MHPARVDLPRGTPWASALRLITSAQRGSHREPLRLFAANRGSWIPFGPDELVINQGRASLLGARKLLVEMESALHHLDPGDGVSDWCVRLSLVACWM